MFKLLFKYLIPLAVILVAGIVTYNYFYGTPEEKEQSRQIISKVTGLGQEVFNLLVSEKEKFEEGKYDDALDKIGSALDSMKQYAASAADNGREWIIRLNDLQQQKQELEQELAMLKEQAEAVAETGSAEGAAQARSFSASEGSQAVDRSALIAELERKIKELAQATESFADQMRSTQ